MKKKRLTCFALAMILCACTCTPAFATEQVEQGEPEEIIVVIDRTCFKLLCLSLH